jgi:hypothetical protein
MLQIPAMALIVFSVMSLPYLLIPLPLLVVGLIAAGPDREALWSLPLGWLNAVSSVFVLTGALKMRTLTSYRQARIAALAACIPLLSPAIYFGVPFGIWAVIVLNRPTIRSRFSS